MEPESILFVCAAISLISILIAAWIFAQFFRIKDQLWYQQKQLNILVAMAKKAGIDDEEINGILDEKVK